MTLLKLAAGCLVCTMFCSSCLGMRYVSKRRLKSNWKTITVLSNDGKDEAVFHLDDYGRLKKGTFKKSSPRDLRLVLEKLYLNKTLPDVNYQCFDQSRGSGVTYPLPIINPQPFSTNDSNYEMSEHTVSSVETAQATQTDENDTVETNGKDIYEVSSNLLFFEDYTDLNSSDTMFRSNYFDDQSNFDFGGDLI